MSEYHSVKGKGADFLTPGYSSSGVTRYGSGIISPAPIERPKEAIDFASRSTKLIKLIDQALGLSNPNVSSPFDIPKLEKQAMLYLKFEDEQVLKYRSTLMPILSFKRIIAGSCYLQYFQGTRKISIRDVEQACSALDISTTKAVDFVNKWQIKLQSEQVKTTLTTDILSNRMLKVSSKEELKFTRYGQ